MWDTPSVGLKHWALLLHLCADCNSPCRYQCRGPRVFPLDNCNTIAQAKLAGQATQFRDDDGTLTVNYVYAHDAVCLGARGGVLIHIAYVSEIKVYMSICLHAPITPEIRCLTYNYSSI